MMDFESKIVSSMCKVFADGSNLKEMKETKLTGLRGETLSFQIAYRWNEQRKNYGTIEVSDRKSVV